MHISQLTNYLDAKHARSFLLIAFEDQELGPWVVEQYPNAQITFVTKKDLSGKSLKEVLRLIRGKRWNVVILSLHASAVQRTQTSSELFISLARAQRRFIRVDATTILEITSSRFLFNVFPKLLFGSILGGSIILWTYLIIFVRHFRAETRMLKNFSKKGSAETVLFLRTDLNGSLQAGGSVSHVKGMVGAFLRAGFRVVYISDAYLESLPLEVEQVVIPPIKLLDFFDEFQLLCFNLQLLYRKREFLKNFRPSLIYQRHSVFNFVGGSIAHKSKIPSILEVNASEVWVKRNWSRLFLHDLAERCEALAFRTSDTYAVISKNVREQISSYGLAKNKFILTPNGVDPSQFHPRTDGSPIRKQYRMQDKIVVGFIGSFTKWHGVETLYAAARSTVQRTDKYRFLFMGDGDLKTQLEQQARKDHITRKLIFTGMIPQRDAPVYLAACDILVSPHLGFEDGTKFFGSPTKLFEYMAMGKAIIASNLEQIGEVIIDQVNGLQMQPGNAQQLSDLIMKLAGSRTLRERLGQRARKDVIDNYTWDINVQRIVQSIGANF